MRSPVLGIGWLLWRRNRWAFGALLAYGGSLALLTRAWPPAAGTVRVQAFAAALPLFLGLLYLMAAFAYPEADLAAAASGFPRPLLLLPVRTGELVFWPMLAGCATLALAWIALARWILIPNGMRVPVGWIAALLAAMLAWLQALCWRPMGLPYLRLMLGLMLLSALPALGDVSTLNGVSPALLAIVYLGLVPLAYGAAAAGVARARRGDGEECLWLAFSFRNAALSPARLRAGARPFASPARAQLWLEWRRNGMMLPLFVGGVGILLTLPLFWIRDPGPMGAGGAPPTPALRDLELNAWLVLQKEALLWPALLAAIVGCGLRTTGRRHREFSLSPFLATRPMTSSALVLAKLQMAALSTLAAWAVMLVFVAIWLLTPAREEGRNGTLATLLLRHCSPTAGVSALLGLLALIGWTWKNQVQGLFLLLSGRRWLVFGVPAVVYGLFLALVVFSGYWFNGERARSLATALPGLIPWLLGGALALKAAAAGWALRSLRRQRLVPAPALAGLVAAWGVLALALFALLSRAARMGDFAWLPVPSGLFAAPYLAAAAALCVPLTRLALAPLALAWNRHR